MDNYEEQSDFEINKAVAEALGHETRAPDFYLEAFKNQYPNRVWFKRPNQAHSEHADYCNDPSHAWPIITENRIGVSPVQVGINRYHPAKDLWRASHYRTYDNVFTKSGDSPLRCAMIVYLMMMEQR